MWPRSPGEDDSSDHAVGTRSCRVELDAGAVVNDRLKPKASSVAVLNVDAHHPAEAHADDAVLGVGPVVLHLIVQKIGHHVSDFRLNFVHQSRFETGIAGHSVRYGVSTVVGKVKFSVAGFLFSFCRSDAINNLLL